MVAYGQVSEAQQAPCPALQEGSTYPSTPNFQHGATTPGI